ncbi:extracellular solute-binding protein (family 3) [Aquabacter spiritensis]|uniref:Extracellular solute-binding protein (Family 3) n=1 Tax=Aquabacter spiritensis TaxID=933073 RepID=A0A4R3LLT3_9HYPH|nr:extracellular solute-binding protein (family 3) [Aquabacter spiritensis]
MNFVTRAAATCAAVAVAGALFVSAAAADALADIEKAKVIRIAVPQDFAPFGSVGPDLQPRGYDIDMANYIGKQLGVKVQLVPVTSANRIAYLQTHKVDLVISSLGKNPEREKVIDFSIPYEPVAECRSSPQVSPHLRDPEGSGECRVLADELCVSLEERTQALLRHVGNEVVEQAALSE